MKWLVVVAGTGLVAWGGYLHWTGWLIVQVERGWSSVIAGAVFRCVFFSWVVGSSFRSLFFPL